MPTARKGLVPSASSQAQPSSSASNSRKRKMDPNAQKYYAVRAGKRPGVYLNWLDCQAQISGFRGAQFKSFLSRADADAFVAGRNLSTASDGTKEERFYAVAVGRDPGIYSDWETASLAIKGWKAPKYKRFDTRRDAEEFIRTHTNPATQPLVDLDDDDDDDDDDEDGGRPAKRTKQDDPDVLHVYTDGSALSNGRAGSVAGVGVWFGHGDKRNVSERLDGEIQTNQRAELMAMLRALETVSVYDKLRIYSDSKYSISCVTDWYQAWQANNWRTRTEGPVKNKDLVQAVRAKIDERDLHGTPTYFQWVKGHAATAGNVAADKLAVAGATQAREARARRG